MSIKFELRALSHLIMTENDDLIIIPSFVDPEKAVEAFSEYMEELDENKNKKRFYSN